MAFARGVHLLILVWKCYIQLAAGKEYPFYDEKIKLDSKTHSQESEDLPMYSNPEYNLANYLPIDMLDIDDITPYTKDISPKLSSAFIGYFKMRAQQLQDKYGGDIHQQVGSDTERDTIEPIHGASDSKMTKYPHSDDKSGKQDNNYDIVFPGDADDYTKMGDNYPLNGDVLSNIVIAFGDGKLPPGIGLEEKEIPSKSPLNFRINDSEVASKASTDIETINELFRRITPEIETVKNGPTSNNIGGDYNELNDIPIIYSRFLNDIPAINDSELTDEAEVVDGNGITGSERVDQREQDPLEALAFNNTDELEDENGSYPRHRRSLYSAKRRIHYNYGNARRFLASLAQISARRRSILDPLASNIIG